MRPPPLRLAAWLATRRKRAAIRAGLEAAAEWHEAAAAESLLRGGDAAEARAHLEFAGTARRAAAGGPAPGRRRLVVPAALSGLALLLLLATLSHSDNRLKLDAEAASLDLRLALPAQLDEAALPPLARLTVSGIAGLDSATLGHRDSARFELSGLAGARLAGLDLPKGTAVGLEPTAEGLRLFLRGGAVRGRLALRQGRLRTGDAGGAPVDLAASGGPDEILEFEGSALAHRGPPILVELAFEPPAAGTEPAWHFDGWAVDMLDFRREQPPGSTHWVSSLKKAEAELPDAGHKFALKPPDWLKLQGVRSQHLELTSSGGLVRVEFDGAVDRIEAGPYPSALEDHTPSWAHYLAGAERLKVLWAALGGLWALWFGKDQ